MRCTRCGAGKVLLGRFGGWAAFRCTLCRQVTQQYQPPVAAA